MQGTFYTHLITKFRNHTFSHEVPSLINRGNLKIIIKKNLHCMYLGKKDIPYNDQSDNSLSQMHFYIHSKVNVHYA